MHCFKHPDRNAVAQCGICSKGLCSECATMYQQPSCDVCAEQMLQQSILDAKQRVKDLTWSQIRLGFLLLWALFFVILGIIGAIKAGSPDGWVTLAFFLGFGGLPFFATRAKASRDTAAGQIEALRGEMFFYHTGLVGLLGGLIVIFLFSMIVTPGFMIYSMVKFFRAQKEKRELSDLLKQTAEMAIA